MCSPGPGFPGPNLPGCPSSSYSWKNPLQEVPVHGAWGPLKDQGPLQRSGPGLTKGCGPFSEMVPGPHSPFSGPALLRTPRLSLSFLIPFPLS